MHNIIIEILQLLKVIVLKVTLSSFLVKVDKWTSIYYNT